MTNTKTYTLKPIGTFISELSTGELKQSLDEIARRPRYDVNQATLVMQAAVKIELKRRSKKCNKKRK